MTSNVNLGDREYAIGHLLEQLRRVQTPPSSALAVADGYAARTSYVPPDRELRIIVDELRQHESALRGFLAQQTGNLEATVRKRADVSSVPAAHLSRGAAQLNHERDRCQTLLDVIADGLATASRCAPSVARPSSRMTDGLESQVGFYRKPRSPHHEYYGAPSVMYETLYRLYPSEQQSAKSGALPVPSLKKHSTDRGRSLVELVRLAGVPRAACPALRRHSPGARAIARSHGAVGSIFMKERKHHHGRY